LEAFVKSSYEYRSDFAVRHRSEALQQAVVELIRAKGGNLEYDLEERLYATMDEELLRKLIITLGPASPEDVTVILHRDLPSFLGA
jgi:hypothetical protein